MPVGIIQSLEDLNRTGRQRKGKFAPFASFGTPIFCPWTSALMVLESSDRAWHHRPPNSWAFELGLNYTVGIPGSPAHRQQTVELLASIITRAHSYIKSPLISISYLFCSSGECWLICCLCPPSSDFRNRGLAHLLTFFLPVWSHVGNGISLHSPFGSFNMRFLHFKKCI